MSRTPLLIEGFTYDPTDHKLANAGTGARSFDANGNST